MRLAHRVEAVGGLGGHGGLGGAAGRGSGVGRRRRIAPSTAGCRRPAGSEQAAQAGRWLGDRSGDARRCRGQRVEQWRLRAARPASSASGPGADTAPDTGCAHPQLTRMTKKAHLRVQAHAEVVPEQAARLVGLQTGESGSRNAVSARDGRRRPRGTPARGAAGTPGCRAGSASSAARVLLETRLVGRGRQRVRQLRHEGGVRYRQPYRPGVQVAHLRVAVPLQGGVQLAGRGGAGRHEGAAVSDHSRRGSRALLQWAGLEVGGERLVGAGVSGRRAGGRAAWAR